MHFTLESAIDENLEDFNLACLKLAQETNSLVMVLKDVPNQPIQIGSDILTDDLLLARSWKLALRDKDPSWILHLAMGKVVVRAIDVAEILTNKTKFEQVFVTGKSKKGWAVWLADLFDDRITAIAPVVADVVDLQRFVEDQKRNYHHSPFTVDGYAHTLKPWVDEGFIGGVDSGEQKKDFTWLLEYIDPLFHLDRKMHPSTKFLLNASGDQFFNLDHTKNYFHKLLGEVYLKIVPNGSHRLDSQVIADVVIPFYKRLIAKTLPAKVTWEIDTQAKTITISSAKGSFLEFKQWTARASAADFRILTADAPKFVASTPSYQELVAGEKVRFSYANSAESQYLGIFLDIQVQTSESEPPFVVSSGAFVLEPKKE
jgi:PhoPQ-activated pathogenicity-related protein